MNHKLIPLRARTPLVASVFTLSAFMGAERFFVVLWQTAHSK
ncbi:MAG: hypothetical protein NTX12_01335 [Actinobacteria bacterium]|nr:hypothetical protein [Actinomycetota bacterium]